MARESGKVTREERGATRGREVAGILLLGVALFVALSVFGLQVGSTTLMGPCGAAVGFGAWALFGIGAYLVAFAVGAIAVGLLRHRPVRLAGAEWAGLVGGAVALSVLVHLAFSAHRLRGYGFGGLVGEYGAELLVAAVGKVGTALIAVMGLALAAVACTPITMRAVGRVLGGAASWSWGALRGAAVALFPAGGDDDEEEEESGPEAGGPGPRRDDVTVKTKIDVTAPIVVEEKPKRKRAKAPVEARPDVTMPVESVDIVSSAPVVAATVAEKPPVEVTVAETRIEEKTEATEAPVEAPTIVEPAVRKTPPPMAMVKQPEPGYDAANYKLPDLSLLDFDDPSRGELDKQAMLDLAGRLERTLADYGVVGRVSEIHPGPVVTMYEFQPKAGTKLSKITALSNDLAMALEALKVRIVAPIPGKAAVGIEVPNKVRETVYLKEIVGDESFQKAKSKLTIALGKDIAGRPTCVDLARMPHLLIAGTTGSGKSVSVNGMICSLLFNATPDEVKLIMIDPKMLELSIYEGIPHLLLPVVTDPKKANLALRWAVDEMERRYDLISKAGVRDIASYNKKVARLLDTTAAHPVVDEPSGGAVTAEQADEISAKRAARQAAEEAAAAQEPPKKLPYIVVIIDEFADLMMVASKEVETSVARIAQKARAAGIHLLLATQRPSVDVITGLIKANFPSRVAFQVASKIDARTILDQQGAESLLGAGDMLFTDRGLALRRIHGALVTDVEVHRVVDSLKAQGKPVYDLDILKPRGDDADGAGDPGDDRVDEFYDQAVLIVAETRIASVSMVQRRLGVGYNRAAKMLERMEREGIVGPANGSKPREVLVAHHAA